MTTQHVHMTYVYNFLTRQEGLGMARVSLVEGGWSREKVKLGSQRDSSGGEAAGYYCCVKVGLKSVHTTL